METENLTQLAIAWKTEMSDKLSNAEINYVGKSDFKTDKNIWNPNLVMKERQRMEHQAKIHEIKFLPLPKESIFVEASKLIRKENSEMLIRAKEERMVKRAIHSLEKSFSEYRNCTKLSLNEFDRLNKGKENVRYTKNAYAFERNKQMDIENFLKNFQKIYKSVHSIQTSMNNQSEHTVYCRSLDKSEKNMKNLRDNVKKDCRIFPYGGDVINIRNDVNVIVRSESKENESGSCELHSQDSEQNKIYPSPRDMPSEQNCKKETALQNAEKSNDLKASINSNFFHRFRLMRYWKAWRKFILRTRTDKEKLMRINKIDLFLKRLTKTVCNENVGAQRNLKPCGVKNSKPATGKPSRRKCIRSAPATDADKYLDGIKDELNKSAVEAYEHLRTGLKNFHPNMRPRAKVLSALPNIDKSSYKTEIKRNYPVPTFLVRMENRYKERKKRWEDIVRRKREIQAEKEQIEKEREEEKMKMEELRKKEKLEELVKKRLERKKAEEERDLRKQQLKKKIRLAQEHYITYLTRRIGFEPWKNLIKKRCSQLEEADRYSQIRTSKLYIKHWRNYTHEEIKQKCDRADELYNHILLKRSFTILVNDFNETIKKLQVALDWCDAKFTEKIFTLWFQYTQEERLDALQKEEIAKSNYNRVITEKYFTKWKKFPEYIRSEKQKEIRKRMLQRRVQEFLPDYQPAYMSKI